MKLTISIAKPALIASGVRVRIDRTEWVNTKVNDISLLQRQHLQMRNNVKGEATNMNTYTDRLLLPSVKNAKAQLQSTYLVLMFHHQRYR